MAPYGPERSVPLQVRRTVVAHLWLADRLAPISGDLARFTRLAPSCDINLLPCRCDSAWRDIMKMLIAALTLAILFGSPLFVGAGQRGSANRQRADKGPSRVQCQGSEVHRAHLGRCRDLHVPGLHDGTRPAGIA